MSWLIQLFLNPESIASSIVVIATVAVFGLILGSFSFRGVSLGIGGVVFSGIILGHFGLAINHVVLEFAREFGLILFVYAIGLNVGPGFIDALKAEGLRLNICAVAIVVGGMILTLIIALSSSIPAPIAVGMFSGGTTNTPSLAAAGQVLKDLVGVGAIDAAHLLQGSAATGSLQEQASAVAEMSSLGYAISYPFGVLGTILSLLLIRFFFRINPQAEKVEVERQVASKIPKLAVESIRVTNKNLFGKTIEEIPALSVLGITISRVMTNNEIFVAKPSSIVHADDVLLAVGVEKNMKQFVDIVGERAGFDLREVSTEITARRIIVTNKNIVGKKIGDLARLIELGVQVTRLRRSGMEFAPQPNVAIHFADSMLVVGMPEAVASAASYLGDSPRQLEHPDIIVLFLGMILGVILGSLPIYVPGLSVPVKLGMAGGPLLVAIIFSRLRRIGPVVSYMPQSAMIILRDVGIILFLACVGLKAGGSFFEVLFSADGVKWLLLSGLLTLVPLLSVASLARRFWKIDYATLIGMMSGAMTNPPALAFAQNSLQADATVLAYASVYPLTMILRIVCAQAIVMILA